MVHARTLHKRYLRDPLFALGKRLPDPEPGLLGDVVDGVNNVANSAVSGVVGAASTVVSDVNALVVHAKATAPATTQGGKTSSSSVHTTKSAKTNSSAAATKAKDSSTAAAATATATTASGGSSSGSKGASNGNGGNSGSNGGSSGSSNGNGSNENSNSGGTKSDSGSDSNSSGGTDPTNGDTSPAISSDSGLSASPVNGAADPSSTLQGMVSASEAAVSGSQTSGVGTGATPSASSSSTGNLNLMEGSTVETGVSGTSADPSPIINAIASGDSVSPSGDSLSSGARSTATISGGSHSSAATGSSGPGSGSDGDVNGNGASSTKNSSALSPGVIAAIAVACSLAFLALLVFILRKWYRNRRARRFEHWVSRPGAFTFFSAAPMSANSEKDEKSVDGARTGSGSGTRSARSSFGTTFDQGLRPFTPDSLCEPSASSFSEFYAEASTPTSYLPPSPSPVMVPTVRRPENAVDRQSLLSVGSSSSSSYGNGGGSRHGNTSTEAVTGERDNNAADAQYLIAPPLLASGSPGASQLSPISVRPWSPSERWAFPKPPMTTAQSTIYYTAPSPPSSQSAHVERVPVSPLPPTSALSSHAGHDPFADPPRSPTGMRPASVESASAASDSAVTAHTSKMDANADALIGTVEHICRPFVPTLVDELAVHRGDVIRVLQTFDDGWVKVEKVSSAGSDSAIESNVGSGHGTATMDEKGLIPVDCLREAGEALPAFLASRRTSSYYGGIAV